MFLTITGKLGSGKSTICKLLAEKHGFKIYSTGEIQRKIALEMGISTLELNELMRKDSKYDDLIDNEVVRISHECKSENIIFDSRMAFHFVEDAYDIFATIDPLEAARRVMKSPRGSEETYQDERDAELKLLERSKIENIRFKEIYKIDNLDYMNYNLIIDTTWNTPEALANIIFDKVKGIRSKKGQIMISPKSLYPTIEMQDINMQRVQEYIDNPSKMQEPIKIVYLDNYHYIIEGHHRVLAALLSGKDFVLAQMAEKEGNMTDRTIEMLESKLRTVGKNILLDYEGMAKFQYKSYPANC